MSKPKDRTGEFMRQHKRILEERTTLLAKIENLETNRERDIAKAVEKVNDDNKALVEELARVNTVNTNLRQTNDQLQAQLADTDASLRAWIETSQELERKLENTAPEFKKLQEEHAAALARLEQIHNDELASLRADVARMDELGARIEERGKRKEQDEARALLNRKAMAQVVPRRNYRG